MKGSIKITYCVAANTTSESYLIDRHIEVLEEAASEAGVAYELKVLSYGSGPDLWEDNNKVEVVNVDNWGGPIGLLDQFLETNPSLMDYVFLFECDWCIRDSDSLKNICRILDKDRDLIYVGHVHSCGRQHWQDVPNCANAKLVVKHAGKLQGSLGSMGKSYWTDGGMHFFRKDGLLKAKEKLNTLPGFVDASERSVALSKDDDIDFTPQTPRIKYHEVGFPSRLRLEGLKFGALEHIDRPLRKGEASD